MVDIDFGLVHPNVSIKKASFFYFGCPISLKSIKVRLNSLHTTFFSNKHPEDIENLKRV